MLRECSTGQSWGARELEIMTTLTTKGKGHNSKPPNMQKEGQINNARINVKERRILNNKEQLMH